jgi:V8-like Glu-specific endopeptidase
MCLKMMFCRPCTLLDRLQVVLLMLTLLATCCCGKLADQATATPSNAKMGSNVRAVRETGGAKVGALPATAAPSAAAAGALLHINERVHIHRMTSPNSDRQAKLLFRQIRRTGANFGMVAVNLSSTDTGDEDTVPAAICGGNSLKATDWANDCLLAMTWRSSTGQVASRGGCTGFILSGSHLGTAGHCVYSFANGANGWADTIDIFCKGANGCSGSRDAYAVQAATAPSWVAKPKAGNGYDVAVIKVEPQLDMDIYTPYDLGMYTSTVWFLSSQVMVSGYPKSGRGSSSCSAAGYKGCKQYSSEGTLYYRRRTLIKDSGSLLSTDGFDMCTGHSGSGIYDTEDNVIVGRHRRGAAADAAWLLI